MNSEFDLEIINSRVEKIRSNLTYLKEIAAQNYEDFVADERDKAACERLLQTSIEAMIDIGNHIIATRGFEEPKEYRDVFLILGQRGVFNPEFTEKLVKMAGLRNRLVHIYMDIDYKKLHEFCTKNLGDIKEFVRVILSYVST